MTNITYRMKGEYTLTVSRLDGTVRKKIGPFPNLITNVGLARITEGTWCWECAIGSGSSTPTVTQTTLDNVFARKVGTESASSIPSGFTGHPTVFTTGQAQLKETLLWRFPIGTVVGNASEVAVGWDSNGTFQAFSRSLILDEFGEPTTFTFIETDIVDVEYTLSMYVPTEDIIQSLFIGTTEHMVTSRPIRVGTTSWRIFGSTGNRFTGRLFGYASTHTTAWPQWVYSAIAFTDWDHPDLQVQSTSTGSGDTSEGNPDRRNTINQTKNGVYSRDSLLTWEYPRGNYLSGIGWLQLVSNQASTNGPRTTRMVRIEPPVMKEDIHNFAITLRNTFARY